MIKEVSSFSEITESLVRIKNQGKGFITNFYPEPSVFSIWIHKQKVYTACFEDVVFFIRKDAGFCHLSYYATSMDPIQKRFHELPDNTYILDIVAPSSETPERDAFESMGFTKHSALFRMSRVISGEDAGMESVQAVRTATSEDIPQVRSFFLRHFDKYTEQIPMEEELGLWIDSESFLVFEDQASGELGGFIIYDHKGMTWYLRYWFVDPGSRNTGVGSALMREAIRRCPGVKRQILWVIESNENAIVRYEHYGFKKERMIDTVLINK